MDFKPVAPPAGARNAGLAYIDHLTHNVMRGNMNKWAGFYEKLFNFREIRYFDIEGQEDRPVLARDDQPLRQDPHSHQRIAGRQEPDRGVPARVSRRGHPAHRARTDGHLPHGRRAARQGVAFQDTPDTYYEGVPARVPGHRENLAELAKRRILIDGNPQKGEGVLLQIFTQNVIGPIFFEIIQRKGNEGFGEGNFRALFESIELDQMRRGVI